MSDMISVDRVGWKDIFAAIGDFFGTSKGAENDKLINDKLENVYKVEKEIGATGRMEKLGETVSKFTTEKASQVKSSIKKVKTTKNSVQIANNELEDNSIENEELEK